MRSLVGELIQSDQGPDKKGWRRGGEDTLAHRGKTMWGHRHSSQGEKPQDKQPYRSPVLWDSSSPELCTHARKGSTGRRCDRRSKTSHAKDILPPNLVSSRYSWLCLSSTVFLTFLFGFLPVHWPVLDLQGWLSGLCWPWTSWFLTVPPWVLFLSPHTPSWGELLLHLLSALNRRSQLILLELET